MRHTSNLAFNTEHLESCGVNMECPFEMAPPFLTDITPVQKNGMSDVQDGNIESVSNMIMGNLITQDDARDSHVVVLTREIKRSSSFMSLQKWEGVVTDVGEISFSARLCDLNANGVDEIAEIPLEEISPDDLSLVRPGGIFSWNIGYYNHKSGQRFRTSIIRFRRMPAWSKSEIKRIKKNSSRLKEELNWK